MFARTFSIGNDYFDNHSCIENFVCGLPKSCIIIETLKDSLTGNDIFHSEISGIFTIYNCNVYSYGRNRVVTTIRKRTVRG